MRLFTAITLPPHVRDEVVRFQEALRALPFRRWQSPETLHVTVHFMGEVDPAKLASLEACLRDGCRDFGAFRLQLDRLGAFPSAKRPQTLWLGIGGERDRLGALEAQLRTRVIAEGIPLELRRYAPHLTLARNPQGPVTLPDSAPAPLDWEVTELVLFQSTLRPQGAHHTPLARFPLA